MGVIGSGLSSVSRYARLRSRQKSITDFCRALQQKRLQRKKLVKKFGVDVECNKWQADMLLDDTTYNLAAVGGIGSGKTFILSRWLILKMMSEAGTGTYGGVFTNTYQQAEQNVMPAVIDFLEGGFKFEYGKDYVYNERPPKGWKNFRSRFPKHNGVLSVREFDGQIVVRSMENYDMIRGIEIGYAGIDEMREAKKAAFDVVLGRVRCPRARKRQIRCVTSPNGYDWIHEEYVEKLAKFKPNERRLIRMRTSDNLFAAEGYEESLMAAYDPKFAMQELGGEFISLRDGAVYHQFDRTVHLTDLIKGDPDLPWVVCFDFNRNPFSVVICQVHGNWRETPDECEIHVVECISLVDAGTTAACQAVFAAIARRGGANAGVEVCGDPAGRQRHTANNLSDYDIITSLFSAKYGSGFVRCWRIAAPSVMARVNAVNAMLRNANGVVRLWVSSEVNPYTKKTYCEPLIRDFERVCYAAGTKDIDKKTDRDLTHPSDAIGYMIEDRFPLRRAQGGRLNLSF